MSFELTTWIEGRHCNETEGGRCVQRENLHAGSSTKVRYRAGHKSRGFSYDDEGRLAWKKGATTFFSMSMLCVGFLINPCAGSRVWKRSKLPVAAAPHRILLLLGDL